MGAQAEFREAIVLGWVDFRERDRIVRLLTPKEGRISALARNVRGSRHRFGGVIDIGNRLEVQLDAGRDALWHLREATLVRGRASTREALLPMALLTYATELVGSCAQEASPEPRLFGLLDVLLDVLEARAGAEDLGADGAGPAVAQLRMALEAKALTFAGFTPTLVVCALCGEALEDPCNFDPGAGGGLHQVCGQGEPVERDFLRSLEVGRRLPLAHTQERANLAGPPWLLSRFAEYHLGHGLRSRKWLASLEGP